MHEDIDRISQQLRNPAFGAYINLEGVFHGVERVVGETVSRIFNIIFERSRDKCFYVRISLRGKETSKWDELVIIVCGSTIIAAHGSVGGEEESGSNIVSSIVDGLNKKMYTSAIVEFIELPIDFVAKKFGIAIESIIEEGVTSAEAIKKTMVSKETVTPQPEAIPASTISIRSSMEKTQILPREVMKKFYQKILPRIPTIPSPREEVIEEERIVETLDDVLVYEKHLLKIMEEIVSNTSPGEANISMLRIRRRGKRLLVEVSVAKLGLVMKREKMMKIATLVADLVQKIISENNKELKFKGIDVVVKHGWDLVKISR